VCRRGGWSGWRPGIAGIRPKEDLNLAKGFRPGRCVASRGKNVEEGRLCWGSETWSGWSKLGVGMG
jgi:hypothetical protein